MVVILYGKLPITVVNHIYDLKNFLHNSYVCITFVWACGMKIVKVLHVKI